MKVILIHTVSGNNESLFDSSGRDYCNEPLIFLREFLYKKGYLLKSSYGENLNDCEWIFFYDETSVNLKFGWKGLASQIKSKVLGKTFSKNFYEECINKGLKNRIVLFLWEPESVLPKNWNSELHNLFPFIFTWNDKYVDGNKFFKIYIPQPTQFPIIPLFSFNEKKLLINISSNKFSSHPKELYSARRLAIKYFEQNQPENFNLFGMGWDTNNNMLYKAIGLRNVFYSSYRGTVRNKWDVLPKYKFSLCYENLLDEPGYITEKIFDSMRSRCVPIYLGASNISDYVSKGSFVDRRDFKSNEELEKFIVGMSEQEYNTYLNSINVFLSSEPFSKFLPNFYADTIIKTLKL